MATIKRKKNKSLPVIGDQDMKKSRQDQLAVLRPGALPCAATEWHEVFGNGNLVKFLL
jgi:hypothetical protein